MSMIDNTNTTPATDSAKNPAPLTFEQATALYSAVDRAIGLAEAARFAARTHWRGLDDAQQDALLIGLETTAGAISDILGPALELSGSVYNAASNAESAAQ